MTGCAGSRHPCPEARATKSFTKCNVRRQSRVCTPFPIPQAAWPKVGARRAPSLFARRNFLLQFFKPVEHDVDLSWGRLRFLGGLEHQEPLAVAGDIVV